MISNEQIAEIFDKMASLIEFHWEKDPADPFRVRAYRKAAQIIRWYPHNIYQLWQSWQLKPIPWLGEKTWAKLLQYLETWTIKKYEDLKKWIPESVLDLMEIPWVWPKLAKLFFDKLWIDSVEKLEEIINNNPEVLLSLPRMGEQKLKQIKKWLELYQYTQKRTPIGIVWYFVKSLKEQIEQFPEVKKVEIAWSTRRMKETVWDIDILCVSEDNLKTMEKFIKLENIKTVLAKGPTKTSVFLYKPHIQVDLRIVPEESWGAALQYFTGSKAHNVHLRTIAKEKGYKISEYGIFKRVTEENLKKFWRNFEEEGKVDYRQSEENITEDKERSQKIGDDRKSEENLKKFWRNESQTIKWGFIDNEEIKSQKIEGEIKDDLKEGSKAIWEDIWKKVVEEWGVIYIKVWGEKEEDIYNILWMDWVPPEMREDQGEIEVAMKHRLPNLIRYDDLKWDLHTHSNWSDWVNSIQEMVEAAIKRGLSYIAITDHSQSLAVANWLDIKRWEERLQEILELRKFYKDKIQILIWTECDILADGSLDYSDEILVQCDIVIASIHMGYKGDMTSRYLKALDNPYITILWHPTTRILWERDMVQADWDQIFTKAIEKNVAIEINSQPLRLDLPDFLIKKFNQMWGFFAINTDAHSIENLLHYHIFGIWQARRWWVEAKNVINTRSWEKLKKWLESRKK